MLRTNHCDGPNTVRGYGALRGCGLRGCQMFIQLSFVTAGNRFLRVDANRQKSRRRRTKISTPTDNSLTHSCGQSMALSVSLLTANGWRQKKNGVATGRYGALWLLPREVPGSYGGGGQVFPDLYPTVFSHCRTQVLTGRQKQAILILTFAAFGGSRFPIVSSFGVRTRFV